MVISVVCKHAKLKALVTSITLQQIKGTEAIDQDRFKDAYCTFQMQRVHYSYNVVNFVRYDIYGYQ